MSDTFETSRLVRLIRTPMRDLVRGRLRSEPNWKERIAAANLPAAAADLIRRIVAGTRLWWSEKADVADELIAHFADGLAAGASVEALVYDFGDERAAIQLIRRAKQRNRSLLWHAKKWTLRGVGIVLAAYGVLMIRFLFGTPSATVNYLALFDAPAQRVPADDRAWFDYRKAIFALQIGPDADRSLGIFASIADRPGFENERRTLAETQPDDPEWPQLVTWLEAHADALSKLRAATTKPAMGRIYTTPDDAIDRPATIASAYRVEGGRNFQELIAALQPSLNYSRKLAQILQADLRVAVARRDRVRAQSDLAALMGIARHQDAPILLSQLVGMGIYAMGLDEARKSLETQPTLFDDVQLVALAHRFADIGGNTASSLIDLSGERMAFYDVVQRVYTDDGHGDGRLTMQGLRNFAQRPPSGSENVLMVAGGGAMSALASRRDAVAAYDQYMDLNDRVIERPLRESFGKDGPLAVAETQMLQLKLSLTDSARLFPMTWVVPSLSRSYWQAERLLAQRDGVVIGIALELYRRQHAGTYPATLDELAPGYLPRLPVDAITGQPLHYKLINGKPMVYSVGADRDDDGGRVPIENGDLHPERAAEIQRIDELSAPQRARQNGDWILFGEEAARAATLSTWRATTRPAS